MPDALRAFEWPLLLFLVRPWCCPHCKDGYYRPAISLRNLFGEAQRRFTARRARGWGGKSVDNRLSPPAAPIKSRRRRSRDRYEKLVPDPKPDVSPVRKRKQPPSIFSNVEKFTPVGDSEKQEESQSAWGGATVGNDADVKTVGSADEMTPAMVSENFNSDHSSSDDSLADDSGKKEKSLEAWTQATAVPSADSSINEDNADTATAPQDLVDRGVSGAPVKLRRDREGRRHASRRESSESSSSHRSEKRRHEGYRGSSQGSRAEILAAAMAQQRPVTYTSRSTFSRLTRKIRRRIEKLLGISRRKSRSSKKNENVQRHY